MESTHDWPLGREQCRTRVVFVGRERERSDLQAGIDDALQGQGKLFLLSGDPGIGKTRLAIEIGATARARGLTVAWGDCCEDGGAPAYWPWAQILRRLLDQPQAGQGAETSGDFSLMAALLGELREGLDRYSSSRIACAADQARFSLFDRLREALQRYARVHPLLIVLDDLHAADLPSLHFLDIFARSLREAHVLVVGTYRDNELQRVAERSVQWQSIARQGQILPLGGLSRTDVAKMVRALLPHSPTEEVLASICTRSEGNPLFVDGLVRLLSNEPRGSMTAQVPAAVRDVIRASLRRLSPGCRQLLDLLCVIGRESETALLLAASNLEAEQLFERAAEACAAGLLDPLADSPTVVRFRHVLNRDVIYQEIPVNERIRCHRSVGEALERVHAGELDRFAAELAHHFTHAAIAGACDKAVLYGKRAAERATAQLAYEEAVRHYRRVVDVLSLAPERDLMALGKTYLALGSVEAAAADAAARDSLRHAADIARVLITSHGAKAEALLAQAVIAVAERGLGMPQPSPDPEIRAGLNESLRAIGDRHPALRSRLIALLAMEHSLDEQSHICMQGSAEAVDLARRVGEPAVLAAALRARHFVLWRRHTVSECVEVATEIVDLAQRCADPELEAQGRAWLLIDHMTAGELGRFDAELGRFAQVAGSLRQPRFSWMLATAEALRALWKGQWQEAERHAVHALALGERTGDGNATVPPWVQMFLIRRERDSLAEEEIKARFFVERFPASPTPRCFLALVLADLGRHDESGIELERLAAEGFANLKREQRIGLLPLLAEICAMVGDARRAEALYSQLLPHAHLNMQLGPAGFLGSAERYLALLAETMGRGSDAVLHAEAALRENIRMGSDVWIAWSQLDLARLLMSQGTTPAAAERARQLLHAAKNTAERLSMTRLCQRLAKMGRQSSPEIGASSHMGSEAVHPPRSDSALHPVTHPAVGVFYRDGELWLVGTDGATSRLRDTKGLHYIAYLLRRPGQEVHSFDLAIQPMGTAVPEPGGNASGMETLHLSRQSAGQTLDARARAEYRERLADLRRDLNDAATNHDVGQISRLQTEIGFIEQELTHAVGLGGRHRRAGSPAEKARLNVSRAIRAVVRRIAAKNPQLGRYLETTIKTGTCCCYEPDPRFPIRWQLEAASMNIRP